MTKKKTPNVKDPQVYETLLKQGMSEKDAAKAAGATNVEDDDDKGHEVPTNEKTGNRVDEKDLSTYEDWTDEQLQLRAKEKGVANYQNMDRTELIKALRDIKLK